ncbi:hypothetical protein Tcan_13744 [Toxocara canis]|uniref:Uncharacterized protein n=1 Tax=Toxocara canis TaxID=6265 RepID=A0A0B2VXQ0_TOXCA|nr:hypothetical protein Tcan_13744 [Toxocara canis]
MMAEDENIGTNASSASDSISLNDSPVQDDNSCGLSEGNLSKISALYEKYSIQCAEIERLEKQNSEYRDQLLKTIHEREIAEESFRACKSEKSSKFDELERKLLEYEYQLKAWKDRSAAQEAHHTKILSDTMAKLNNAIAQLSKKCEVAEKEKNDAVVRYATREAEVMHLKSALEKIESEKASLIMEKDALIQSTKYQRLQDYKQSIETAQKDLESEKQMRAQQDETLAITTKRFEALQTVVAELRSMLEQSQKQLAKQTEEKLTIKSEHEKLLQQVDNLTTSTKLIEVEAELRRTKERADEAHKKLEYINVMTTAEIASLREELNVKITKVQELSRLLDETRNEKEVLKKKNASNIKA